MKPVLDDQVHKLLKERLIALEDHLDADVLTYFGPFEGGETIWSKIIEQLVDDERRRHKIYIILTTVGVAHQLLKGL
jgi:hypothetical protein